MSMRFVPIPMLIFITHKNALLECIWNLELQTFNFLFQYALFNTPL